MIIPKFFPKVVFNKPQFICYVLEVSKTYKIAKENVSKWLDILNREANRGAYCWGMIYVNNNFTGLSRFVLILHEFIHHLSQLTKILTGIRIMDTLNDLVWIMIEKRILAFKQLLKLRLRSSR